MLEGDEIEQVEDFKFLGSTKTTNDDITKEIKERIAIAREKTTKLLNIMDVEEYFTAVRVQLIT